MRKKVLFPAIACLAVLIAAFMTGCKGDTGPAGPTGYTAQFQNGMFPSAAYAGISAVQIGSDTGATSNYSALNPATLGYDDSPSRDRFIFKADVSSIVPANVIVTKAYLTVISTGAYGTNTYTVYKLTRAFTAASATWEKYDGVNNWTSAGGDFDAVSPVTSRVVNTYGQTSFTLSNSLVQGWLASPSTNYGVLIKADESGSTLLGGSTVLNYFTFNSNAVSVAAASRPMLTVYYRLP
jgi:hypothetical protein